MSATAILVLDLQADFLRPEGRMPADPRLVERLIPVVNSLIDAARHRKIDVAFVADAYKRWDVLRNFLRRGAAIEGSPGAAIDSRIHRDVLRWPVFNKASASAFGNPALEKWLLGSGASRVVIAGVMADASVLATAKTALRHGLSVTIVSDGVAARTQKNLKAGLGRATAAGAVLATGAQVAAELGV